MAVFGALILSVIAAIFVSKYLDNIDFIPSISAAPEVGCPKDYTGVAINNYPGLDIANTMDDKYKHQQFEDAMDGNYRCSEVCVPKIDLSKGKKISDETNLNKIQSYLTNATIGGQPIVFKKNGEEFKTMLTSNSGKDKARMAQTVVLNSTKTKCEGAAPGSTSGASVDYDTIKLKGTTEVKLQEENMTCQSTALGMSSIDPTDPTPATNNTVKPTVCKGAQAKTAPSGGGAPPSVQKSTGATVPSSPEGTGSNVQPVAASSAEVEAVNKCWVEFEKVAAEHISKHLGINYPPTQPLERTVTNVLKRDFIGGKSFGSLHPGGQDYYKQLESAYKEYANLAKKNKINASNSTGLLQKCQTLVGRTASLSVERNDIDNLETCKNTVTKQLLSLDDAKLNILDNERVDWKINIFGFNETEKEKSLKNLLGFLWSKGPPGKSNFTISINPPKPKQRYVNFQGALNANLDLNECKSLRGKLTEISNRYPSLNNGMTKVTIRGNIAVSNKDLTKGKVTQKTNASVHICVYLSYNPSNCKKVITQAKDGNFSVDFYLDKTELADLVQTHGINTGATEEDNKNKRIFVYAATNTKTSMVRNRYVGFAPNDENESYLTVTTIQEDINSDKAAYVVAITDPIVLYGSLGASPKYSKMHTVEVVRDRFISDTGGKNCFDRPYFNLITEAIITPTPTS